MNVLVVGGLHERSTSWCLAEAFRDVYPDATVATLNELQFGTAPDPAGFDVVVWARDRAGHPESRTGFLDRCRAAGTPTVGFHTDHWWGLPREQAVAADPFFRCDWVVTTDGDMGRWAAAGVNAVWMAPAVRRADTEHATQPVGVGRAVFVGAWERYYPEWPWRQQLVRGLRARFGPRFTAYPLRGKPPVHGPDLAAIIATAAVVVGDSIFAGTAPRSWSDRVPITLGMGGMLVHPAVDGLDDVYTPGEHLVTVPPCDLDAMCATVDRYLTEGPDRGIQAAGRAHVRARHTFDQRVVDIIGLVSGPAAAATVPAPEDPAHPSL